MEGIETYCSEPNPVQEGVRCMDFYTDSRMIIGFSDGAIAVGALDVAL